MAKWVCFDIDEAVKYFGKKRGDPEYDSRGWIYDVNGDDHIDMRDIVWFSRRYGVAVHAGAAPVWMLAAAVFGGLLAGVAVGKLWK